MFFRSVICCMSWFVLHSVRKSYVGKYVFFWISKWYISASTQSITTNLGSNESSCQDLSESFCLELLKMKSWLQKNQKTAKILWKSLLDVSNFNTLQIINQDEYRKSPVTKKLYDDGEQIPPLKVKNGPTLKEIKVFKNLVIMTILKIANLEIKL